MRNKKEEEYPSINIIVSCVCLTNQDLLQVPIVLVLLGV